LIFRQAFEKREAEEISPNDRRLLEILGVDPETEYSTRGKAALREATVFACIKILAESVSKLPLKIYQEDGNGFKRQVTNDLATLLKLRPNPYMSASDFWRCVETQRNMHKGNAYVNIEFDDRGNVVGLWPIDQERVTIYVDDTGYVAPGVKLWYEVETEDGLRRVMPDEMLHFKSMLTLDGIVGISPLDSLKGLIEGGASAQKFMNNFYKQGLQVKGIVQYVGDLNEKAKKEFRERFESMSSGLKNSHRIALMPVGYQYQPISLTMHDAQFFENNKMTVTQIASAFGIKLHQLNDLDRSTHTNMEQQEKQFYMDTMQPILTMYEQEMTYKLFTDRQLSRGYYLKFNVDSILRGDLKARYEAYKIGIEGGFLKPNEARVKEEMPTDPAGDRLYANGNIIPLEMAGDQYVKGGGQTEEEGEDEGNTGASGDTGNTGSE